ncbi:MAG: glycosyltransferase family 4 protein [Planctomycetota bacterium]
MNVALTLFRYFPHGGMQRDLVATARALQRRGHTVQVFCHALAGERPEGLDIEVLDVGGTSNHGRARRFATAFAARRARQRVDVVIGFDKMPGLDLYFAADVCFVDRTAQRPWPYRLTPRHRTFRALEQGVFGDGGAHVLLLSERERRPYQQAYGTPDHRFTLLPPGVARDRRAGPDAAERRARCRGTFGFADDTCVLLMLASNYRLKGLMRVLDAMRALPAGARDEVHLLAVGEGPSRRWTRAIARRGLQQRCTLLPGRDDVPDLLQAADLLVHPARRDNTGTAIAEALVAGLPVLCTDGCGYATHVEASGAGRVVMDAAIGSERAPLAEPLAMLMASDRDQLRRAALRYTETVDMHRMHERIVDEVERRYPDGSGT